MRASFTELDSTSHLVRVVLGIARHIFEGADARMLAVLAPSIGSNPMNIELPDARFAGVLFPEDLARMSVAVRDALQRLASDGVAIESELVARIILKFYRRGLVDTDKLADVAVLVGHSKLFRHSC